MKGRPVRGLFGGLILGILVDIDLVFSGAVKLSSVALTIIPPALLVIGLLLGLWAPLGRGNGASPPATGTQPAPVPAGAVPPEPLAPGTAVPPPTTEDTPPI